MTTRDKPVALRELLLPTADSRGRPGKAAEAALREAVRSGQLPAHTRLPSSRDLAAQLGIARGTVTAFYNQLIAEGYLLSERGSGTRVASVNCGQSTTDTRPSTPAEWRYDFKPGLPALSAFPRAEWLAAERDALTTLTDAELGYPDPIGRHELRVELASYLGRVRALPTDPADLVITSGAAEGLSLLAKVLHRNGENHIAVEDPSHLGQASLLESHGLSPVGVPVDEDGIDIGLLDHPGCRTVLVSAAHQFPLGMALHPRRRRALLDWAQATGGLVLEDDYDAEHRYDRPALGAVRALDPARVAYIGSVSKVLAPALRIGWLVLPPRLREQVAEAKHRHDLGCPPLPQAALARLLRSGGYDRHLRRTRRLYRQRRDALLDAMSRQLPSWRPVGIAAGLHVVMRLPEGTDDLAVQQALAERGINVPALSGYAHSAGGRPFPGLVFGYAASSPDRLRAAVAEIAAETAS